MIHCTWRRVLLILALTTSGSFRCAYAEDAANNGGDDYYNDDGGQADEAAVDGYYNDYSNPYENNNGGYKDQGDEIKYWTEYAILPNRCISYNDVDVIVFSMYENGYKQCSDTAMGTYVTPVSSFMQGYLNQKAQDAEDQGMEYEMPSAAQYAYCTPFMSNQVYYYFQLGCSDTSSHEVAVNIYEDNTCTKRSAVEGLDDANIDVSDIQPSFKKCYMCVNWFDRTDDQPEVDDGFYENRMTNAPLCATPWSNKESCGSKCQHIGMEKTQRAGFSASDQILLAILVAFGLIMVGLIARKRYKMSNKDTLLEQASLNAAGLQQPHVLGIFIVVVVVIAVVALLGRKNITWALLLIINAALFTYLMKLTIASSANTDDTIIGPDGTIMRNDSDDSSVASATGRDGTYNLPVLD